MNTLFINHFEGTREILRVHIGKGPPVDTTIREFSERYLSRTYI
jgi:hypothetical protein